MTLGGVRGVGVDPPRIGPGTGSLEEGSGGGTLSYPTKRMADASGEM